MTIDSDLLIKLFDTLKETDQAMAKKVEKQTDAIVTITHSVESIKNSIGNHSDDAKTFSDNMKETKSTVDLIWNKVRKMYKSVNTMIIVVLVAFSLMTVAYFIVKHGVDEAAKETKKIEHTDAEELSNQIKELRKMIEKMHPN